MIPILYAPTETTFTHNGIGVLSETLSCFVSEQRNGGFECDFAYPINGRLYSEIETDCIVKAKANDTSRLQLFRIYKHSKPINGVVTFYAEHISYELSKNPIEEVSVQSANAQTALNAVLAAGIFEHNFTAQSDIDTLNSTSLSFVSMRSALGGVQGSILDTYGGEYEFDNYTVKLHRRRGTDTGIKIAYGKNLTDVKQEKNIASVYTAIYPYAKYTPASENGEEQQEITVTLAEKVIYSQYAANYATVRVCIKDFSDAFGDGETPTETTLRAKAQSWVNTSGFDIPSVSITVSFKHLWQSPEYAKYAPLERVGICDTVTVEYAKLGISVTAKIIKTKYNTLKEDYESLELGDAKANFADTYNSNVAEIAVVKQEIKKQTTDANTKLAQAVAAATAAITGQSGGHVVLNPANNPQEILIMDTPNIETALRVWRWNALGLGYSSTGYNGDYKLAMTTSGAINADMITLGNLNANIIKSGRIESEQPNGGAYFDLNSGELGATKLLSTVNDISCVIGNDGTTAQGLFLYKGNVYKAMLSNQTLNNKDVIWLLSKSDLWIQSNSENVSEPANRITMSKDSTGTGEIYIHQANDQSPDNYQIAIKGEKTHVKSPSGAAEITAEDNATVRFFTTSAERGYIDASGIHSNFVGNLISPNGQTGFFAENDKIVIKINGVNTGHFDANGYHGWVTAEETQGG